MKSMRRGNTLRASAFFSQGSCTPGDLYRTWTWTPALFQLTLILLMWRIGWAPNNTSKWQMEFNSVFKGLIFQWILPPFRTARLANLSPKHKCLLPAAIYTGPPRPSAFCLTRMMQSYIIQFERLPTVGTDCCPPRQPAFCVAEP
jgi:hypothetical protein